MNRNIFFLDEMEQTGNKIRLKNKMKLKTLMAISVNFLDEDTLKKIQRIFHSITPEEMKEFKAFLNGKGYIKQSIKTKAQRDIIRTISRIALCSLPKDEYLRKIMQQYCDNINKIDELKVLTTKTYKGYDASALINQINEYNEENILLFEKVQQYRESKTL